MCYFRKQEWCLVLELLLLPVISGLQGSFHQVSACGCALKAWPAGKGEMGHSSALEMGGILGRALPCWWQGYGKTGESSLAPENQALFLFKRGHEKQNPGRWGSRAPCIVTHGCWPIKLQELVFK